MAKQIIYFDRDADDSQWNREEGYRVKFAYDTFGVTFRRVSRGKAGYLYKRINGRLHQIYLGMFGSVTTDGLRQKAWELARRIEAGG
jgi:hypothetical protein